MLLIHTSKTVLFSLLVCSLAGCAKSTTQSEFDCPLDNGVPVCLDTYDVDVAGDIPKSADGERVADLDTALPVTKEKIRVNAKRTKTEEVVRVENDTTYPVKPLIVQPVRRHGNTERMWFAAWEDKKHDLFIDQQYIYWSKPGQWTVGRP
jgi:hypothetical protein